MAFNLWEQVQGLATPDVVSRVAGGIGESPQATERALTGGAMPAVLAGVVQRFSSGAGPQRLIDVVKQHDPDGRLLDTLGGSSAQGVVAPQLQTAGQGLMGSLFGPRSDAVADVVAGHGGIKKSSAMSLLSIAGAMILGFLGQKVARGGLDANGLGSMLNGARGELGHIAPPGLAAAMGVPAFGEMAHAATGPAAGTVRDTAYHEAVHRETGGPGGRRWIPWAIAAIVLLGALALFRTCRTTTERTVTTTAPATAPATQAPATTAPRTTIIVPPATAPSAAVQLPSGVRLNLPTSSLAYGLASYLGDANAAAPPKRFTFENLVFPTNGSNLSQASGGTLRDVVQILNAYPNAKVRVEGFTDNVGDAQANLALSQRRATSVQHAIIDGGVAEDRVSAQGFGQDNPVGSNDTEAGRQQNRRTDLVVTAR